MKKKLEELNLLDDFLFGTLISHPVYGERFVRILIKTILNKDIKILKIRTAMRLQEMPYRVGYVFTAPLSIPGTCNQAQLITG